MTATGKMPLRRFWIEFGPTGEASKGDLPRMHGITACSIDDALAMLQRRMFRDHPMPPVGVTTR